MSRSYKKPFVWCSKCSTPESKRAYRHATKQDCHEMEIDFDPDRDFDEFHRNSKEFDDWGTKMGFNLPPSDADDTWWHESYVEMRRK